MGARYRPPALRALASGGDPANEVIPPVTSAVDSSILPPTNYPPGFRRARAGTLPSNVQLAAQRFAAASPTGLGTPSSDSFADQQSSQRPSPSLAAPTRPNLRHSATVTSTVSSTAPIEQRNSRLRSGSLTLPSAGLSNAFGPSIFSSSWVPNGTASGGYSSVIEELRSVTSADSVADDFDVHTLDYLGLDDSLRHPPAATMTELRNQAQAAIAGNISGPSSRLRASTVSNPYRTRAPNSLLPSTGDEEDEYYDEYSEQRFHRERLSSYDAPADAAFAAQYVAKGFKPTDHLNVMSNRPRAISVGNLDDSARTLQRRATSAAETAQMTYMNDLQHQNPSLSVLSSNVGGTAGILKVDKLANPRASASTSVHFPSPADTLQNRASPYLLAPSNQNRAVSPKTEQPSSQIQTPTRSLWIGNLDSAVTSEQLIHVFAPYGAIESLRLLPEKECGFVNFVDQADAVRAKEDVLNRLGGNIGMPNGQTVRIGFGKADSAPIAPAKNSPVGTATTATPAKTTGGTAPMSGMDAQLQSTPTRALWIGSIPSTTTPATILSVFSPYGPIESARVLTHKNCGFINFERLDDAVRARKALNGRDVLGSDVGAIRIGFAKVPVKNGQEGNGTEDATPVSVQGVGGMSVGATIHALRGVKGASTIPTDQQVLSGVVENYRSNLLLSLVASGLHTQTSEGHVKPPGWAPSVTEQQMIMREISSGAQDAEPDIRALAEFRPPTMYYTTIPLVSERPNNRRWDAAKLRELRKRLDSGSMTVEEIDAVSEDFLDGEIVDLASDWLGNTVVQKLFERCNPGPRYAVLERLAPHLAMIGIHKNGTWAAQKIIECVQSPEEIAMIAQNLRPYAPPLLLDQFGNYVIQCCLRFGAPANDFIFDAIVDRMWEVAQGRFGARSMRACLESPHITISQQRRVATAIILNSIPLATNPNGALLLTWLLDSSNFPSRYNLLAPRFTPHLSHLCTHKLASLTVLRIVNQKIEPEASTQIIEALFSSPGDHVLTDVLGDQVNGVAVVHKILTSPFIDPTQKASYIEATKRVLIELKVIATQAYRRLIEEVGLPLPNFQPAYPGSMSAPGKNKITPQSNYTVPGLPSGYPSNDQNLAAIMASLQMGGQNPQAGPPQLHVDANYSNGRSPIQPQGPGYGPPGPDPYNPYAMRTPDNNSPRAGMRRNLSVPSPSGLPPPVAYSPSMTHSPVMNMGQPPYGVPPPQQVPPQMSQMYPPYMYQPYQQNPSNMGAPY